MRNVPAVQALNIKNVMEPELTLYPPNTLRYRQVGAD